jgi:hypothetical protein
MHRPVAQRIGGKVERGVPERARPAQIACLLDLPVEPAIGPGEARIGGRAHRLQPVGTALQPRDHLVELHPQLGHRAALHMRAEQLRQPQRRQPQREDDRDGARQREAQAQAHAASRK